VGIAHNQAKSFMKLLTLTSLAREASSGGSAETDIAQASFIWKNGPRGAFVSAGRIPGAIVSMSRYAATRFAHCTE